MPREERGIQSAAGGSAQPASFNQTTIPPKMLAGGESLVWIRKLDQDVVRDRVLEFCRMKHISSFALGILFGSLLMASVKASDVKQEADFLAFITQATKGFTTNYDFATKQLTLVGKEAVLGTRNTLAANLIAESIFPVLTLRIVPYVEDTKTVVSMRLKAQTDLEEVYLRARESVPRGAVVNDPREFIPETSVQWQLVIKYQKCQKALADVPTHHWQKLGVVLVLDKLVTPDDPNSPEAREMNRWVGEVLGLLEAYSKD